MDKKLAGLLGAVSALVVVDGASASTSPSQQLSEPGSYADLLTPIPNAAARLKAADDARAAAPAETGVQVADQVVIIKHRHHHHHHFFRHHHHHHHHHHHD